MLCVRRSRPRPCPWRSAGSRRRCHSAPVSAGSPPPVHLNQVSNVNCGKRSGRVRAHRRVLTGAVQLEGLVACGLSAEAERQEGRHHGERERDRPEPCGSDGAGGCDSYLFVPFGDRRWDGDLDGQTEERDGDDGHETVTAFAAEYKECVLFAVLRSRALNLWGAVAGTRRERRVETGSIEVGRKSVAGVLAPAACMPTGRMGSISASAITPANRRVVLRHGVRLMSPSTSVSAACRDRRCRSRRAVRPCVSLRPHPGSGR